MTFGLVSMRSRRFMAPLKKGDELIRHFLSSRVKLYRTKVQTNSKESSFQRNPNLHSAHTAFRVRLLGVAFKTRRFRGFEPGVRHPSIEFAIIACSTVDGTAFAVLARHAFHRFASDVVHSLLARHTVPVYYERY